ncbi:hypothetical protein GCM10025858_08760 [Alicyclobacillus sacchari]|nr:hypothetical protein GCM10025858_08760 [Alicyclobacillus sacchari]
MSVQETTYAGESAILLQNGDYEAILLPKRGGNLVGFRDVKRGYRFLREPEYEMDQFEKSPIRYGIPVLFPPNRYRDGVFTAAGRTYHGERRIDAQPPARFLFSPRVVGLSQRATAAKGRLWRFATTSMRTILCTSTGHIALRFPFATR